MTIIIGLISISITIAVGFLASFLWSLKSGQFDDTYSPSVRMLFDDRRPGNRVKGTAETPTKQKDDKRQQLT